MPAARSRRLLPSRARAGAGGPRPLPSSTAIAAAVQIHPGFALVGPGARSDLRGEPEEKTERGRGRPYSRRPGTSSAVVPRGGGGGEKGGKGGEEEEEETVEHYFPYLSFDRPEWHLHFPYHPLERV